MRENNYKEVQKSIDQKYPERGKKTQNLQGKAKLCKESYGVENTEFELCILVSDEET